MRRAVFLQARVESRRLPGKALLPLAGKPVIAHAMESLIRIPADVHAILTDPVSASTFDDVAQASGFQIFEGEPDDVLKRFADAARHFEIDRYFRATGDNPLVSARLAEALERDHVRQAADFSGYLGLPLGTGVECVEASAILSADEESEDQYEREHASPFIYRRPERFRIVRPWAPEEALLPGAEVTLDTPADYQRLELIYEELYDGAPIETSTLVEWFRAREVSSLRNDSSILFPIDSPR